MEGRLLDLFIAPTSRAPMQAYPALHAIQNVGLAGDRYATAQGRFSRFMANRLGYQVTFISIEAIEKTGFGLAPALFRRNLLTEGLDLKTLLHQPFQVGEVSFRGVAPCSPCGDLAKQLGLEKQALRHALPHFQGGLRALILSDGILKRGDPIVLKAAPPQVLKPNDQAFR